MHNFIINASIQIVPIVQDRHPYEWVDEAIDIIKQSGLTHEVQAFGTVVEGTYAEVRDLIDAINEYLYQKGCSEWICQLQIQLRANGDMTATEKDREIPGRAKEVEKRSIA